MSKFSIAIFSIVFMGLAAVAASLETQSHRTEPNLLARSVFRLPVPALVPSTLHSHYYLRDCSLMFLDQRALLQQGYLGSEFLACEAMAEDITQSRPTQGLAWLILGLIAELEGKPLEAKEALAISQAMGPNELFLAQQRISLHQLLLSDPTQSPTSGFWQDAEYSAAATVGRQMIASLYLRNPQVRNQFDAFLEQLSDRRAEAMLREIERVLEGGGS